MTDSLRYVVCIYGDRCCAQKEEGYYGPLTRFNVLFAREYFTNLFVGHNPKIILDERVIAEIYGLSEGLANAFAKKITELQIYDGAEVWIAPLLDSSLPSKVFFV